MYETHICKTHWNVEEEEEDGDLFSYAAAKRRTPKFSCRAQKTVISSQKMSLADRISATETERVLLFSSAVVLLAAAVCCHGDDGEVPRAAAAAAAVPPDEGDSDKTQQRVAEVKNPTFQGEENERNNTLFHQPPCAVSRGGGCSPATDDGEQQRLVSTAETTATATEECFQRTKGAELWGKAKKKRKQRSTL